MNKEIRIFTTIDQNWLAYALMFVASVKRRTSSPVRYTIFCAGPTDTGQLAAWAAAHQVSLEVVDFNERIKRSKSARQVDLRVPDASVSACAFWGRYCAEFLFDDLPGRLIYADVDMYAQGDLLPLMDVNLGSATVGAVRYPNDDAVRGVGIPAGQYVNNGLLVFETSRFNGRECIQNMQHALESGLTVFGPQCAFNMAMRGKISLLDENWNVQGERRSSLADTARLIHFTGQTKPWHTLSVDPLRWDVRELLRETGCAEAWRPDLSISKMLRLVARRVRTVGEGA